MSNTIDFLKELLQFLKKEKGEKLTYKKKSLQMLGKKIINSVINNKKIIVYGDYDADGIFSSFILFHFLKTVYNFYGKSGLVNIAFSKRENEFGLTFQEYKDFSNKYDLIITTDNGSDLPYLSDEIDNLLIIDHHPTQNSYEYIINPNIKRSSVSTSGGRVVYDLIERLLLPNMRKLLIKDLSVPLDTYKELSAITLISDMASLTKENREFIQQALKSMKDAKMPMSALLREFTALEISFKIISPINAYSRMQKNLQDLISFIAPKNYEEFKEAQDKLYKNNQEKIKLVNYYLLKTKENNISNDNFFFYFNPEMPIGLNGLIANKINSSTKKNVVIASLNGDKIVGSARGKNVKEFLSLLQTVPTFEFGGHMDACGFKLQKEYLNELTTLINETIKSYNFENNRYKVINNSFITGKELNELTAFYKEESGGAGFKERIFYSFKGELEILSLYRNGYANINIKTGDENFNTILTVEEFENIKDKDVFIGELKEDGGIHIVTGMNEIEFYNKCEIINKSVKTNQPAEKAKIKLGV